MLVRIRLYERWQFRTGRSEIFVAFHVHPEPTATPEHQTAATVTVGTAEQIAAGQPAQLLRGHRHSQGTRTKCPLKTNRFDRPPVYIYANCIIVRRRSARSSISRPASSRA